MGLFPHTRVCVLRVLVLCGSPSWNSGKYCVNEQVSVLWFVLDVMMYPERILRAFPCFLCFLFSFFNLQPLPPAHVDTVPPKQSRWDAGWFPFLVSISGCGLRVWGRAWRL